MTLPAVIRHVRSAATRPGRFVAVAAFLFVAGSVDRADASCGDWLAGHEATPAHAASDADGPNVPLPCDGPGCRRSQDHLPAVPPAPAPQVDHSERWCRLVEELASRPPVSSLLAPQVDQVPARGFAARVDRPPRV